MKAVTSNLALRFYVHDGWTFEILTKCLDQGRITVPFQQDAMPYFILDIGSRFDVDKLAEKISTIDFTFKDQEKDIRSAIEDFNW